MSGKGIGVAVTIAGFIAIAFCAYLRQHIRKYDNAGHESPPRTIGTAHPAMSPTVPETTLAPRILPKKPPTNLVLTPAAQALRAAVRSTDLPTVGFMIRDYRLAFGGNPIGSNAEITRALNGGNPKRAKFLPPSAPVNDQGEMIDRWGHPYFFHQISGTLMEIHSAGPDGRMFTADDVVYR